MTKNHHGAKLAFLILILIGAGFLLWPKLSIAPEKSSTIELSEDQKSILSDGTEIVSIEDDEIFNFFQNSELCNESNIQNTPTRDTFCSEVEVFKKSTEFKAIFTSPQTESIAFTIQSSELSPDTVVGIYQKGEVTFITDYYLGNEFLGFSPNGSYLVYQGNCWEGKCGLFIRDSITLEVVKEINNPEEGLDFRTSNARFLEWLNDHEIRYQLGDEIKTDSIQ